ncbi:hypothetical protein SDRG_04652 [Saprolegnia diclina VS20]|uniref:Uncharacterized protein n=1 Tax=Saprolegnia diclina (strain VS20) TaxID=1156394 RepID=T0QW02_SAPDV|nr:hypothetical protein SDRG_04652 [Saprolegnia diclina VS20]EQC38225.1 hypothetical protein SDRG_04652 [Saprolegnia diclina VS20]|eukprot:XP_008608552.1 hypothetical protein SDRG_04652 [Saprolegnia diclina VS20]
MDEAEFSRLLGQFPVVRQSTYCRVAWKPDATPRSTITQEETDAPSKKMKTDVSLSAAIETYMQEYFTPAEATRIRVAFEKAHADLVDQLCLEDVEDMCHQFQ